MGYCLQVGALVEPPAYHVYEVLLPDEVANRWGINPHQLFMFAGAEETLPPGSAVTLLHYGHPLVETIVEEISSLTANGQFYINNVRLEKPGLFNVIEKTLVLPNAKLFPVQGASEQRRLYHYVRFNLKASLIADEKRELILPIWMHLQGGYPVDGRQVEHLAVLDAENNFQNLDPAMPTFLDRTALLSEEVLRALLERARQSTCIELGDTLQSLHKRLQRFLELDRARLDQYYEDLIKDAERRLQKADEDRRKSLEAKITAIEAEHQSKLIDVEQKYRLRIELDLANLAVISQPKLDLTVEIRKRTATVRRQVIWDPLLHAVEPLVCDVCGQAGFEMYLCENGHLAHAACLAPQCVECKRTYCQKCAGNVQTCVVCDRPICTHSLVRCPTCQRVTCQEHANLCHAADGKPQHIEATAAPIAAADAGRTRSIPEKAAPSALASQERSSSTKRKEVRARPSSPAKAAEKAAKISPALTAAYVDVYFGAAMPLVSAYVMVRKREVAVRSWELTDEGISVSCRCENLFCKEDGMIYRPVPDDQIPAQIDLLIHRFIAKYNIPEKKIHYFRMRNGEPEGERKLVLTGMWKDAVSLQKAPRGVCSSRVKMAWRKPKFNTALRRSRRVRCSAAQSPGLISPSAALPWAR